MVRPRLALIKEVSYLPLDGAIQSYFEASTIGELLEVLNYFKAREVEPYLLGEGSDTLFASTLVKTPVIRCTDRFVYANPVQIVVSGFCLARVAGEKVYQAGFSNLIGVETIPGTIGAGIKNNASFKGFDFFTGLRLIATWRDGRFFLIPASKIRRSYRHTDVEGVVLAAFYEPVALEDQSDKKRSELASYRLREQDITGRNLGSTFLNPPGHKAYELLGEVMEEPSGGAVSFSKKHHNFLDVEKGARPEEVYSLVHKAQQLVAKRFGITLQLEIKIVR